jgi:thioredoxin:protein disulfide reductase
MLRSTLRTMLLIFVCLIAIQLPALGNTNTASPQLTGDQAFNLTVEFQNGSTLVAHWNMPPGYMLYQKRIQISAAKNSSATIGKPMIPPNDTLKQASVAGNPVFENYANAYIPIKYKGDGVLRLLVRYQGCKGEQYCYPPVTKLVTAYLNSDRITVADAPAAPMHISKTNKIAHLFSGHNDFWIILSFFGFGLLLTFTPCVLPMLPILFSVIIGQNPKGHAKHTFILSSLYVLSMAITFAIAGIIAAVIGRSLQSILQNPFVIIGFSLFFVALAFSLFGAYEIQLPSWIRDRLFKTNQEQKPGSYWGAIVMGGISTLIVSPCVTPPLIGALIYIANTGNMLLGGFALFALGLGMGAPFILLALLGSKAIPKAGQWMNVTKPIFGIMMLALALWLVGRLLPGTLVLFLFGVLAVGTAIFGGLFRSGKTLWQMIWRVITLILFLYGLMLMIGGAMGNDSFITPLETQSHHSVTFIQVHNMKELDNQLQRAKQHHQKVILDFYADWCTACQEMNTSTFVNPAVIQALKSYRRLQVNLTQNDKARWKIAKKFNVYAPPSFVFYDTNGKRLDAEQIFGKVSARDLLAALRAMKQ